MSGDIRDRLSALGIGLRSYQPGEHRAPCPWCDKGDRDDALAVRLDDQGATWFCHRCEETGAARPAQDHSPRPQRREPRREPERHETLSDWGRRLWECCRPIDRECVAGQYLTGRGCRIPPLAGDLRWHPEQLFYVKDQREPIHKGPALVGLVTDIATCEPINLHRTWITATGKADLGEHKPRKLLWRHRSDGVIRLWPDDEVTMGLVLG